MSNGSYGEDRTYLREIRRLMEERSVTCPLFTSDGPWRATLKAGTLIEDDLCDGELWFKVNFNFSQMQEFFDEHDKKWPLMYGILGWMVLTDGKNQSSRVSQRS